MIGLVPAAAATTMSYATVLGGQIERLLGITMVGGRGGGRGRGMGCNRGNGV